MLKKNWQMIDKKKTAQIHMLMYRVDRKFMVGLGQFKINDQNQWFLMTKHLNVFATTKPCDNVNYEQNAHKCNKMFRYN